MINTGPGASDVRDEALHFILNDFLWSWSCISCKKRNSMPVSVMIREELQFSNVLYFLNVTEKILYYHFVYSRSMKVLYLVYLGWLFLSEADN